MYPGRFARLIIPSFRLWIEASTQPAKRTLIDWGSVVMLRECNEGTEILFYGTSNWVKIETDLDAA